MTVHNFVSSGPAGFSKEDVIKFRKLVVGVMGGGEDVSPKTLDTAYQLGKLIAREDWVLLCGGRPAGVMEASAKGAKEAGGLTVGILPERNKTGASEHIDIAVFAGRKPLPGLPPARGLTPTLL